jgi:hypothetical protein
MIALTMALLMAPARAADPQFAAFPHGQPQDEGPGVNSGMRADGHRYFVWRHDRGVMRIYDDETRTTRDAAVPDECRLQDTSTGVALLHCGGSEGGPRILLLRSGSVIRPAGAGLADQDGYAEIGRHWLETLHHDGAESIPYFLNWRTGERRSARSILPLHDLDDPKLGVAPPGTRIIFQREGPYTLRTRRARGKSRWEPLVLERRGHPTEVLSSCRGAACESASISEGLVTWSEELGRVRAYDIRRGRLFRWVFHDWPGTIRVMHTRRRVLTHGPGEPRCMCPDPPYALWVRVRK